MRCVPDAGTDLVMTPVRGLVALVLCALVVASGAMSAEAEGYRWGPPDLTDPETITLPSGPSYTRLARDRDYVIRLPGKVKTGFTMIEGGRNILILGGHISISPGGESDTERRGLYIKNVTGIVHIEGVLIEGDVPDGFDAIAISAPLATVQIVNVRVEGVTGRFDGFHGDIVQPFGGVYELRIDHLTGTSNYQGLYLAETSGRIGTVDIRNVDLDFADNRFDATTYLLWLPVESSSCETYPIRLESVYIEPRPDQDVAGYAVWPNSLRPPACAASEQGATVSWPELPDVEGRVIEGSPPGGDFVLRHEVGLDYRGSPDASPEAQTDAFANGGRRGARARISGMFDEPGARMSGTGQKLSLVYGHFT